MLRVLSRFKSQSSLVLKFFATVPSYTSTKVVSGVSSKGRTYFYDPEEKNDLVQECVNRTFLYLY